MAAGAGGAALAAPLLLLYYGFSIGITFYNKWLMKSFPFPLLVTLLHLLLIFGLSALARALARCRSSRPRAALSWADCLRRAAPAALSTSLDIGLSNWSFLYVTVSLYTMTKSSAILFILLFSLLFKLEEVRVALLLVVLLIAGGLFMFTYKSTQFNTQGFVLVLCASFLGGIRWTLTQILMQKAELAPPPLPCTRETHLPWGHNSVYNGSWKVLCPLTCGAAALFLDVLPKENEMEPVPGVGDCVLHSTLHAALNSPSVSEDEMDQPWPSRSFLDSERCSSSPRDEAFLAFLACALNLQNHQQGLHGKHNNVPLRSTENRHSWHSARLCSSSHGCVYYKSYSEWLG
ncbi:solute carrier family 35 member C2 isoform 6-T8 [Chlamydotis macqueenii]